MKNKKITFLILHYLTLDETYKCVDYIKNMCGDYNYEIVIVDNGSNDGSATKLKQKYEKDKKIHMIFSEDNLGFARGNNLGFKYAKEKLKSDFIVMLNNDTYILQTNFCQLVLEEYENSNFAVLGPRIIMNNNKICDFYDKKFTVLDIEKKLKNLKIKKFFYDRGMYKLCDILIFVKNILKKKKNYIVDTSIRKENIVLQGCFLIFSREYIDKFDGIDDRTFLYNEEQLLYIRLERNKLKSVYNPYIFIFHNENASTNKAVKNSNKKKKFVVDNEIQSTTILLEELRKDILLEKKKKNI